MPRPYPPEFRRPAWIWWSRGGRFVRLQHRDLVDRGLRSVTPAAESAAVEAAVPKDRYRPVAELRADGVRGAVGLELTALACKTSYYGGWTWLGVARCGSCQPRPSLDVA
jgi:hypothetical protein